MSGTRSSEKDPLTVLRTARSSCRWNTDNARARTYPAPWRRLGVFDQLPSLGLTGLHESEVTPPISRVRLRVRRDPGRVYCRTSLRRVSEASQRRQRRTVTFTALPNREHKCR